MYDFDRRVDLTGFGSVKHEGAKRYLGGDDLLPMWVADMDFAGPREVTEALIRRAETGVYGYSMRTEALDAAIIGWMERRHGWTPKTEWIVHSPGVVTALAAIVQIYTSPGDGIVIQPPVYPPFSGVVKENDRQLIVNPLKVVDGRYEMDLDDLRTKLEAGGSGVKMLILCSPHNPVGRVWSPEELEALIRICREFGVLIVSDEIHADLVLRPHKHTVLANLMAEDDRFIICMAPSKTFNMAGLQSSYVILPNEEMRAAFSAYMARLHLTGANAFALTASEAAYRHGDEWLDRVLTYIGENVDSLLAFAEAHLPGVQVTRPEGTYLVWMDFRSYGRSPAELEEWMKTQARVALNVGGPFGEEGDGFLRLNAAAPRAVLEEALRRIRDALPALAQG